MKLFGIEAKQVFQTMGSVSFALQRAASQGIPGLGTTAVLIEEGWIDVHYPCDGHIKARIRIVFLNQQMSSFRESDLFGEIKALFEQLGIPCDETYEVDFIEVKRNMRAVNPKDRHGQQDRT